MGADHVVAFEAAWLERVRCARLAVYEMPSAAFEEALPGAGYWISRSAVEPVAVRVVDDALAALAAAQLEVRMLQEFWPLRDAVARSSLQFSIIRQAGAAPRRG